MGHFSLDGYAPVEERIVDFYTDYPDGSIRTFLAKVDGPEVIFEARVYRNTEEAAMGVYTSGWAREVEGKTPVNKTSHIENCETSAVGRALANLNYSGHRNGAKAPRPSREEMQKVQRMGDGRIPLIDKPEAVMPFGKTKGMQLTKHTDEQLAKTISWCRDKDAQKFAALIADMEAIIERRGKAGVA